MRAENKRSLSKQTHFQGSRYKNQGTQISIEEPKVSEARDKSPSPFPPPGTSQSFHLLTLFERSDLRTPRLYSVPPPKAITQPFPRRLLYPQIHETFSGTWGGGESSTMSVAVPFLQEATAPGKHFGIIFLMTARTPVITGQSNLPCHGNPNSESLAWVVMARDAVSGSGPSLRLCISAPKGKGRLWPWSESLNHRIPQLEEP